MDEEQLKAIYAEIDEIIKSRLPFVNKHYLSVREAYHNPYDWPEMDPLRHEICICIIFGLCQAAITLTNHLLESLLKNALIINLGGNVKQKEENMIGKGISSFIEKYSEPIKTYDSMNLSSTINRACAEGLIDKEQKKRLHEFRERFRNAYGHSDKSKTFGESTVPVTSVRFSDQGIETDEVGNPEIAKFLIGQGLIQCEFAQKEAAPYFLYIDRQVREIWNKLFKHE